MPCCAETHALNRFELKYLVTLQQAARIRTALAAFMTADRHGSGRYGLSSLYYDSPDLRCYYEKTGGECRRRKLRIRFYETAGPLTEATPVFVEIKERIDRITRKRRVTLPYGQALRLCSDRQEPAETGQDPAVIEEILAFAWMYDLRPVSIVRYDRQALVGGDYDRGLRVTFDTCLSFQVQRLHLHEEAGGLPMLPAHQAVMEIKVDERIPLWLTEMIRSFNLSTTRISKYCRSIEAAWNMPALQLRACLPESAGDFLASAPSLYTPLDRPQQVERL